MYLIISGKFYTDGRPIACVSTLKIAQKHLKQEGFKPCKDEINHDLYERVKDGNNEFARLDEIEYVG